MEKVKQFIKYTDKDKYGLKEFPDLKGYFYTTDKLIYKYQENKGRFIHKKNKLKAYIDGRYTSTSERLLFEKVEFDESETLLRLPNDFGIDLSLYRMDDEANIIFRNFGLKKWYTYTDYITGKALELTDAKTGVITKSNNYLAIKRMVLGDDYCDSFIEIPDVPNLFISPDYEFYRFKKSINDFVKVDIKKYKSLRVTRKGKSITVSLPALRDREIFLNDNTLKVVRGYDGYSFKDYRIDGSGCLMYKDAPYVPIYDYDDYRKGKKLRMVDANTNDYVEVDYKKLIKNKR